MKSAHRTGLFFPSFAEQLLTCHSNEANKNQTSPTAQLPVMFGMNFACIFSSFYVVVLKGGLKRFAGRLGIVALVVSQTGLLCRYLCAKDRKNSVVCNRRINWHGYDYLRVLQEVFT